MEVEPPPNDPFEQLDGDTAALILQLQSRDIEELLEASKGKGKNGDMTDAELAVATYQEELEQRHIILNDRRMGQSITAAIISDEALLQEALTDENAAADDRALARRLAEEDGQSHDTRRLELRPYEGIRCNSKKRKRSSGDTVDHTFVKSCF